MEAKLIIANASLKQVSGAIVILAGLLTGFFWLGYWTAEFSSLSHRMASPVVIEKNRLTAPTNDAPSTLERLGIHPEDSVRL